MKSQKDDDFHAGQSPFRGKQAATDVTYRGSMCQQSDVCICRQYLLRSVTHHSEWDTYHSQLSLGITAVTPLMDHELNTICLVTHEMCKETNYILFKTPQCHCI